MESINILCNNDHFKGLLQLRYCEVRCIWRSMPRFQPALVVKG